MDNTTQILIIMIVIFVLAVLMGFCLWVLDMAHRWGAKSEAKLWKEQKRSLKQKSE